MAISRIRTLTAPVADQDRALTFFRDALGFEIRTDSSIGEHRWLEVAPPGAETAVVLHLLLQGVDAPALGGVILETHDLDADVERLQSAGAIVDGPKELPWGRQATFSDPDGNGFVLTAP